MEIIEFIGVPGGIRTLVCAVKGATVYGKLLKLRNADGNQGDVKLLV